MDLPSGMFAMGQYDEFISKDILALTAKEYPSVRVESVLGANDFLQEYTPKETNDLLRHFFGSAANDCPTDPFNTPSPN